MFAYRCRVPTSFSQRSYLHTHLRGHHQCWKHGGLQSAGMAHQLPLRAPPFQLTGLHVAAGSTAGHLGARCDQWCSCILIPIWSPTGMDSPSQHNSLSPPGWSPTLLHVPPNPTQGWTAQEEGHCCPTKSRTRWKHSTSRPGSRS